ncbi:MAG: hypothetical protein WA418_20430 [Bradyrhizobium sp.]
MSDRSGSGAPLEQTCGVQKRVHLADQLLHIENDGDASFGIAGIHAGFGCCSPDRCSLIEPLTDAFQEIRNRNCWRFLGHHGASVTTTHAPFANEVEQKVSNFLALLPPDGSSSKRRGSLVNGRL